MNPYAPGPTAQVVFAAMIRELIAPRLRRLGFKESGQTFTLPDDAFWALVGFQKSRWSDRTSLQKRIGLVMPQGKDHWWELTPRDDVTLVANEVP